MEPNTMFPSLTDIEIPLLKELAKRGGSVRPSSQDANGKNVYEALADYFGLTQEERERLGRFHTTQRKYRNLWENEVQYVRRNLVDKKLISNKERGVWTITPKAYELLGESSRNITNSKGKPVRSQVINLEPLNNQKRPPSIIEVMEGKLKEQKYIGAERNQRIVAERRKLDHCTCQACGFYLKVNGMYVIEVHHLFPLANHTERITNVNDLVCLCPTCHTMAHLKNPPYTIEQIKEIHLNK
ncbi:MAG: hypothetical protein GC158_17100 [Cyanobacteria bacterium RI_101]|nr:hypothetical protein [Cyanobacteria bacterium RI_101]